MQMLYTRSMGTQRLEKLARELGARDPGLEATLADVRQAVEQLRGLVDTLAGAFKRTAREAGAAHLANLEVGPVEPDEKHIDCIQFRVARGRWEIVCVAKAKGNVTLVGPFRRGKPEKPCADHPLRGTETEQALEDLLVRLIEAASER